MSYDLAGFVSSVFCVKDSDGFAYDMAPLSSVFKLAWEDREAGRCRLFMAKNCEGWPFDNACTFEDEGGELQDPYMNLDDDDEFDLAPISQPHLQPGSACAIKAASIESCSRGVRFVSFWIKVITESGSEFFHTHDIVTTMASKLNETFTIQWE